MVEMMRSSVRLSGLAKSWKEWLNIRMTLTGYWAYLVVGIDRVISTQLLRVLQLRGRVRKRVDLRAHRLREHDGVVAEPSDADDPDLFPGAAAVCLEGRKDSEAGTHHRGGVAGLDILRNGKDEALVGADGS